MNKKQEPIVPLSIYAGFLLSLMSLFILPGILSMIFTLAGVARIKKFPEIFQGLFIAKINMILSWLGIISGTFLLMVFMIISPVVSDYLQSKFQEKTRQDMRRLGISVKLYQSDNNFLPENLEILKHRDYLLKPEIDLENYSYQKNTDSFTIKLKR